MHSDDKIREWITGCPGTFAAATHTDVLDKVRRACGVSVSLHELERILWRYGYKPQQVRDEWRLSFPDEKSPGVRPLTATMKMRGA